MTDRIRSADPRLDALRAKWREDIDYFKATGRFPPLYAPAVSEDGRNPLIRAWNTRRHLYGPRGCRAEEASVGGGE